MQTSWSGLFTSTPTNSRAFYGPELKLKNLVLRDDINLQDMVVNYVNHPCKVDFQLLCDINVK